MWKVSPSIFPRSFCLGDTSPIKGRVKDSLSDMQRQSDQVRTQEASGTVETSVDMQRLLIPVYRLRYTETEAGAVNCQKKEEIRKHLSELKDSIEVLIDEATEIIDESTEIRALIESLENIWDYTTESLRTI